MADDLFVTVSIDGITPEHDAPAPEKLVSGDPRFTTWNMEESADGKLFAGVWEATPGKWRIAYEEWEYCRILAGISIIADENGNERTVRTGDSFLLRPGFTGTWHVVETTRKEYVIRL